MPRMFHGTLYEEVYVNNDDELDLILTSTQTSVVMHLVVFNFLTQICSEISNIPFAVSAYVASCAV